MAPVTVAVVGDRVEAQLLVGMLRSLVDGTPEASGQLNVVQRWLVRRLRGRS